MSTQPIQLAPKRASHELIDVCKGLLEAATSGDMSGLVFGAQFQGQRFYCDAAGALHRSPVTGLGVAMLLASEMEHRIRSKAATETI